MNEIEQRPTLQTARSRDAEFQLSASARDRLRKAKAASTLLAYRADLRRFLEWAVTQNLLTCAMGPDDDDTAAALFAALLGRYVHSMHLVAADYIDHLATQGKAPSSIDRALAAITVAHRAATGVRLATEAARDILRAYRRETADAGRTVRKAKPVTVPALRLMIDALDPNSATGIRDRCLLVIGFALGARRQELADLQLSDLAFTPEGIEVSIRRSKTDTEAVGRTVALPYGAHRETCPVRATLTWIGVLAHHNITSGPLLRRIDRHGTIGRVPHGRGNPDGRITGQSVSIVVRRTAHRAGLSAATAFSGHSLRRGFATETYRVGADMLRIARHGGWKDGSGALAGYIEDVNRWRNNPLAGVGL